MTKPQVFVVLDVDDIIRLEIDFVAEVTRAA